MPLFSIPLSGLTASEDALNVISNNLANLNTVGYKDETANFQDLFYQSLGTSGSGDPMQLGSGAAVGSVTTDFSDGNVSTTGVDTDVAITGEGFFVTEQDGVTSYTRAGNFSLNSAGQLVTADGAQVMGYAAVDGAIPPGQTLGALTMGQGEASAAVATTTMQQQTNLDAGAAVGATYSTPITVYDSLGESHVLTFNFTKTASNTWSYQVTLPAADTGGTGAATVLASGTLDFDSSGNLISPTGPVTGITATGLADGAANLNMTWDLTDSSGNALITQDAGTSATSTTDQNGYTSGTLQSYTVNPDGTIEGTFSNGQTQTVGQIALANFADEQGLSREGDNSYQATLASGAAVVGTPESGGRGSLTGDALELSNVDLSTEFTALIVTQQGFEANARVVTTFDTISEDTLAIQPPS
jgi:flagellar hook protein FlgE